jgi:hypothetical protein
LIKFSVEFGSGIVRESALSECGGAPKHTLFRDQFIRHSYTSICISTFDLSISLTNIITRRFIADIDDDNNNNNNSADLSDNIQSIRR